MPFEVAMNLLHAYSTTLAWNKTADSGTPNFITRLFHTYYTELDPVFGGRQILLHAYSTGPLFYYTAYSTVVIFITQGM